MITTEEYEDIQVGDKIKIVDRWNEDSCASSEGKMDYLLGQTFEVVERATKTTVDKSCGIFRIESKDGVITDYWYLNDFCIEKVIKCTGKV